MPFDAKALQAAARAICRCELEITDLNAGIDAKVDVDWPEWANHAKVAVAAYLEVVSETHVLVPRVATQKMLRAGIREVRLFEIYTAMIKTAEQPDGQ